MPDLPRHFPEEDSRLGLLARNDVRLFLTSLAILFVELLLIRWIPANVKYIGFFSNFLLIASFLGIGLGILLGRKGGKLPISPFALFLAAVVAIVYNNTLNVQVDSQDELFFGLAESQAADVNFLILPLVVALVVGVLATLALPLGPLLKSMPPLRAYGIDIAGSMAGIALFSALSAAGTPPVIWFAVGGILVMSLELGTRTKAKALISAAALLAIVLGVFNHGARFPNEIWSPYYRISSFTVSSGLEHITVDGIPHQALHPLGEQGIEEFYEQVYRWFPGRTYPNVLIVGAGSGSDVAIALSHGAGHVDAVEIDPKLQQIGSGKASKPALFRLACHSVRQRRAGVPAHHRREIRPRDLRPARFADAGQPAVEHPARVVPVHGRGIRKRPRPPD